MDLLKIKNNEALLCLDGAEINVSKITTAHIDKAVGVLLDNEDVQIALEEDPSSIVNPAQKIIFEQLRSSFKEVQGSRESILADVDKVFASAEAQYFKTDESLENEKDLNEERS